MAIPAAAHVVVWLALGTGVVWVVSRERAIVDRIDKADAERCDAPATTVAPVPLAASKEVAKAEEEVRTLRVENGELKSALARLRSDHDRLAASVLAADARGPGEATEGGDASGAGGKFVERPGFEEAVRAVVDRYATEAKFREALKKAAGPLVPKKPQFAELAKALSLTQNQSTRFADDIRGIQTELFEVLQMPREDGVVPFEEIQQAEQYPEGSPKKSEIFLKLFKNRIPGTEETYLERAVTLVGRVKKSASSYLDDGQRTLLDTIDLDWFGIKMQ